MSYIYRLPEKCNLYPNKKKFDLNYLSIKKSPVYSLRLGEVAIYAKNKQGEGIFGFGELLNEKAFNSSQLDPDKKIKFFNRNYFQVKIKIDHYSTEPILDIRYLRHFPAYNSKIFDKPFNPFILYWAGGIHWEWNYLRYRFPYHSMYFCEESNEGHLHFYIHILRENRIKHYWNLILPKENNNCAFCGLKSDYPNFLEIHDTFKIDFDADFKAVNIKDFIVLCPNCHKKEHLNLRDKQKETNSK